MQISKEYLAGFFDGEGCIYLGYTSASGTKKKYPSLIVTLAQSGEEGLKLLLQIQKNYGGRLHHKKKIKVSHKEAYQLRWRGKNAILFLDLIGKYLNIKQQKASDVCNFMDEYYAR